VAGGLCFRPLKTGITSLKLGIGVWHRILLFDFPHKITLFTC